MPLILLRKLAHDIFHFENYSYLLVVDCYSRFPMITKLDTMTAQCVKSYMQTIFSEYGWLDTLVSDNDPYHNATEFRQAMEDMAVHHKTSSSHFHQSNRLPENYVQLENSFLSKAKEMVENPHFALMLSRNNLLGKDLQYPVMLLCAVEARSYLSMSHAARMQVGQATGARSQVSKPQLGK